MMMMMTMGIRSIEAQREREQPLGSFVRQVDAVGDGAEEEKEEESSLLLLPPHDECCCCFANTK